MIKELNELFHELVPACGSAGTKAGEIVRALSRLGYRWINDGDRINEDYGKESCNAAARFLMKNTNSQIKNALQRFFDEEYVYCSDETYESALNEVIALGYEFICENPELKAIANDDDYLNYLLESDRKWGYEYDECYDE